MTVAGGLLYKREIPVTDHIHIVIPTVGEVLDHEEEYYGLVSIFTAMPIDMMVELDDIGIDFTSIDEYDLFLLLSESLRARDTSLVISGVDFKRMHIAQKNGAGEPVLLDTITGFAIDRKMHARIADTLRMLHHLEKDKRKPIDKPTRDYMVDRARRKRKRHKNDVRSSQLEDLIVAMVNTEQFSYTFETVKDMTIYQFNRSMREIINKVDYDNRMQGVYSGTVNPKDLSQSELTWLTCK